MAVTILAFVYVPSNLVTSLFGMNIQQLNQSGQQIQTFFATLVAAVALTYSTWFIIEQRGAYIQWRKAMISHAKERTDWPKRKKRYCLAVRISILNVLLYRGYGRWLWGTRAWIRILTNDRFGNSTKKFAENDWVKDYTRYTSCDYACKMLVKQPPGITIRATKGDMPAVFNLDFFLWTWP